MDKIIKMLCHPYLAVGKYSEESYGQQITGEIPTYKNRQKKRVQCSESTTDPETVLLASHDHM